MELTSTSGNRRALCCNDLPIFSDDEDSHGTVRFSGLWGRKRLRVNGSTGTHNHILFFQDKSDVPKDQNTEVRIAVRHSHGSPITLNSSLVSQIGGQAERERICGSSGTAGTNDRISAKSGVRNNSNGAMAAPTHCDIQKRIESESTTEILNMKNQNRGSVSLKGKKKGKGKDGGDKRHNALELTSFDDLLSSTQVGVPGTALAKKAAVRGRGGGGGMNPTRGSARGTGKGFGRGRGRGGHLTDRTTSKNKSTGALDTSGARVGVVQDRELGELVYGQIQGGHATGSVTGNGFDIIASEGQRAIANGLGAQGEITKEKITINGKGGSTDIRNAKGIQKGKKHLPKSRNGKVAKLRESLKRQPKRAGEQKAQLKQKFTKNKKQSSANIPSATKQPPAPPSGIVDTGITGLSLLVQSQRAVAGYVIFDGVKGLAERERQRLVAAEIEEERKGEERQRNEAEKAKKQLKRYACKSYIKRNCDKGDDCYFHHNVEQDPLRICSYYSNGYCSKGDACPFSHDCERAKKQTCAFYLANLCMKGQACQFSHEGEQVRQVTVCKYFLDKTCTAGGSCRYEHNTQDVPCADHFFLPEGCLHGDECIFSHKASSKNKPEYLLHITQARAKIKRSRVAKTLLTTQPVVVERDGGELSPHDANSTSEETLGIVDAEADSTIDVQGIPSPTPGVLDAASVEATTLSESNETPAQTMTAPLDIPEGPDTGVFEVVDSKASSPIRDADIVGESWEETVESDEDEWI
ncbi:hypothetical protein SARC_08651 [Sphaeroforma arctica JP610]|uniref:C3H1-type domain-containing protein n=1 Tax=Sphaeroforma arctica JP610 TaxID=667725 RepID=A0A0L0FQ48_9EUKA|nr:hypothetical protein SARC_08651 [Sphaeroforma arctica JP610]KNC78930.1 hypothetical protein SARC_08651 [Sphaeroforma arctica JP610]|eukprot:XP_014152832.1 hypothetical protein SARC_08651 [Sphaeroforma arctica JP610]